ncbi:hypothetical protein GCM10022224_016900 [Nonomuraea antimicrobica]|uniref:Uncharacterized protein n=1 Tax=Nonomuraea antimicrobica TaxID=561173 RepID=A0ABP7BC86_9ACTN
MAGKRVDALKAGVADCQHLGHHPLGMVGGAGGPVKSASRAIAAGQLSAQAEASSTVACQGLSSNDEIFNEVALTCGYTGLCG